MQANIIINRNKGGLVKEQDKSNIMIVEDHGLFRTGLKSMLEKEGFVGEIIEAESGEKALELCHNSSFPIHLVLMDIRMPGIGGLEATLRLQRMSSEIKVLVVTVCDDALFPTKLLQAGANGYVTKDVSYKELLRAIKVILSGQRYISHEIARQLAIKHLSNQDESPFDKLSERELQVALMVSKGIKVNEISDKLCLSPKTVNSYRYRIFSKLGISGDVELTHLAIKFHLHEDSYASDKAQ